MYNTNTELQQMFRLLNNELFDNRLIVPWLEIGSTSRFGKTWRYLPKTEKRQRTIKVSVDRFEDDYKTFVFGLVSMMIHLYCDMNHIKDCCKGGQYCNSNFAEQAREKGFSCSKSQKYGVYISDVLPDSHFNIEVYKDMVQNMKNTLLKETGKTCIKEIRIKDKVEFVCPKCDARAIAFKNHKLICGNCLVPMIKK